jgi:hypothetical protein
MKPSTTLLLALFAASTGCGLPPHAGRPAQADTAVTPADVDALIKQLDRETYQPELPNAFQKLPVDFQVSEPGWPAQSEPEPRAQQPAQQTGPAFEPIDEARLAAAVGQAVAAELRPLLDRTLELLERLAKPAPVTQGAAQPPPPPPVNVDRPQIVIRSLPNCAKCNRIKTDFANGPQRFDVTLDEDYAHHAKFIRDAAARIEPGRTVPNGYPIITWKDSHGRDRFLLAFEWKGVADFLERWERSNKQSAIAARPAPAVAAAGPAGPAGPAGQVRTHYPIRGHWWTGCKSWRHLTQGEHAGKFDPAWLQSLSWSELQSVHSDDHDHRVHWQFVQRPTI